MNWNEFATPPAPVPYRLKALCEFTCWRCSDAETAAKIAPNFNEQDAAYFAALEIPENPLDRRVLA